MNGKWKMIKAVASLWNEYVFFRKIEQGYCGRRNHHEQGICLELYDRIQERHAYSIEEAVRVNHLQNLQSKYLICSKKYWSRFFVVNEQDVMMRKRQLWMNHSRGSTSLIFMRKSRCVRHHLFFVFRIVKVVCNHNNLLDWWFLFSYSTAKAWYID